MWQHWHWIWVCMGTYKLAYRTPMTFTIWGKVERMVNWPDLCWTSKLMDRVMLTSTYLVNFVHYPLVILWWHSITCETEDEEDPLGVHCDSGDCPRPMLHLRPNPRPDNQHQGESCDQAGRQGSYQEWAPGTEAISHQHSTLATLLPYTCHFPPTRQQTTPAKLAEMQ